MHKPLSALTRGLEDAETVTVAFLVAVGAAEQGRPTLDVPDQGSRPPGHRGVRPRRWPVTAARRWRMLVERYAKADGRFLVCPVCMQARNVDPSGFLANAQAGGTAPMWEWIGDDPR